MGQKQGRSKLPPLPRTGSTGSDSSQQQQEGQGPGAAVGTAIDAAIEASSEYEHLGRVSGGSCEVRKVREKATGKLWVVKLRPNPVQCQNEKLAAELYNRFGGKVPRTEVIQEPGCVPLLCQEYIEGVTLLELRTKGDTAAVEKASRKLCDAFAIDCLLGNWDVVGGRGGDNILVDTQGEVWRIDNAGCFGIRAQGAPKGTGWCPEVTEIFLMRDVEGGNTQAAECLKYTTDEMAIAQITALVSAGEEPFNQLPPADKHMCMQRVRNMEQWVYQVSTGGGAGRPGEGVDELVAMGFDREAAATVLEACGGNTVEAICILSSSENAAPPAAVPGALPAQQPDQVDEGKIAALTGMGVDREIAISALAGAGGSVEAAIACLFD
eukprot:Hpha_TRINITY_DN11454_c0_g1::TRINITY_DN11454_c0_g1_i1::g.137681::m.137681